MACKHSGDVMERVEGAQLHRLRSNQGADAISMHPLRPKKSVPVKINKKDTKSNTKKLDKRQKDLTKSFIAEVHTYRAQIPLERTDIEIEQPLPPIRNHYTESQREVIIKNLRKDIDLTTAVVALQPPRLGDRARKEDRDPVLGAHEDQGAGHRGAR